MKCLKCHRALVRFAASIEINGTRHGWGPICAKEVGASLMKTTRAPRATEPRAPSAPSPQPDLFEEVAAA